jgi:diguanylate cyclase (GGDEF)-like protein
MADRHVEFLTMAASERPPPPHPKTNGYAVLEPPTRPPPALSAEQDPPGRAPHLIVIHAKEANMLGRRFVLERSPARIGCDAENDIVLQDASASPRHAHLEERAAEWWCVDDGSTDGVYIDDRRMTGHAALTNGTRIGIGATIFKFLSGRDREAQYHEEIYRITIIDGLTQVHVKRYLLEALDKEILRARRHERSLALLMMEVDEIEAANRPNTLRNADDHVMSEVASFLRPFVRHDWILARYGDQRFAMVLPDHTVEMARIIAERLRETVATSPLAVGGGELRATICIGGAQRHGDDRTSREILERASRALRVATSRGRNQLECEAVNEAPDSAPGA